MPLLQFQHPYGNVVSVFRSNMSNSLENAEGNDSPIYRAMKLNRLNEVKIYEKFVQIARKFAGLARIMQYIIQAL